MATKVVKQKIMVGLKELAIISSSHRRISWNISIVCNVCHGVECVTVAVLCSGIGVPVAETKNHSFVRHILKKVKESVIKKISVSVSQHSFINNQCRFLLKYNYV